MGKKTMSTIMAALMVLPGPSTAAGKTCHGDAVHQLAPAASLADARLFDGSTSYADLLTLGNLGLGAVSPLEGEVIVIDGVAFHADVRGDLTALGSDATTPFAVLKCFGADSRWVVPGTVSLAGLTAFLDGRIRSPNLFHAVRVDGTFSQVRLRSVPRQRPPYASLHDVVADQTVFELNGVRGTAVGFRFPSYLGGVNADGWHFHFVDRRRHRGGHVLDLQGERLHVALDTSRELNLILPADPGFEGAVFSGTGGGRMEDAINPSQGKNRP